MTDIYHTSIVSLTESIRKLKQSDNDEWELVVLDSQDDATIVALTHDELAARNLRPYCEHVCRLTKETHLTKLHFHESKMDGTFSLTPIGTSAIDPIQATQPQYLGGPIADVATRLNDEFDIGRWDFGKVNGASIATGGYVTDYEFEYETVFL